MRQTFHQRKIVVVGAGRSGIGLATYFHRRGAAVTLSDRRQAEQFNELHLLESTGATLDLGGHSTELFIQADLVVVSPGVPLTVPAVAAARERGVPVRGEIEIAFSELSAPLVAITGTNGKSTTTMLLGEIFKAWEKKVFTGGNLGAPLIEAVDEEWDWVVAELSSFQLETIRSFRPRYALLLNISADHLDRYSDMKDYIAAKARIFENMTVQDAVVLNADDAQVMAMAEGIAPCVIPFSSNGLPTEGMGLCEGEIVWRMAGREERFAIEELQLKGRHNLENVMAAMVPPLMEGCPPRTAWQAVCSFCGLPHRMELVRVLDDVTWYDDSKGTNVGSVVKSLAGLKAPVTLIACGKDKGGDYAPLIDPVRTKVSQLILIGEAADRMAASLSGFADTVFAASLEEAVRQAWEVTPPGGSVLLSPGCSSFDMFSSFAERGEVFAREVNQLPERMGRWK